VASDEWQKHNIPLILTYEYSLLIIGSMLCVFNPENLIYYPVVFHYFRKYGTGCLGEYLDLRGMK
jgi:hypothetical protein